MTGTHLHIERLTVHIDATTILRDVTIDIAAGSRHAIVGANGAGKSTLLAAIAGTRRLAAGRIMLDGRDITRHPADRVARLGVARIWQQPAICHSLTALANVEMCLRGHLRAAERRTRALAALQDVDLVDQATITAGTLSYGQQRRLELAIALATTPRLLLLDEPSAGLTATETTRLIRHLRALGPDTTILVVEHDRDLVAALADGVTTLDHGVVIGQHNRPRLVARSMRPGTGTIPRFDIKRAAARRDDRHRTAGPVLQVRHLSAGYRDTTVLEHIDLDVAAGEILHIDGPNGAGKTTLLCAIAGLTRTGPETVITVHGHSITGLTAAQRAHHGIVLVPQDGHPFTSLTIAENLNVGSSVTDPLRWPVADLFDAMRLRPRLNDRAYGLSGGERQIIVLAQALAAQPAMLLLDEPFARLAPAPLDQVRRLIIELAEHGSAILLVDHTSPDLGEGSRTATLARWDRTAAATLHSARPPVGG